jgi:hypothetical protein
MKTTTVLGLAAVAAALVTSTVLADTYSIPKDACDVKRIFWGDPGNFEKAAEVDYCDVVKATPQYREIKKEKIERGTGKYWILVSQASDLAVRAIAETARKSHYDLIAASGYLGGLQPAIPAEDITADVIKHMKATKDRALGTSGSWSER